MNQKFEQLLQVLEDAESTSGLEPPAAQEAKPAHACINGRRVEVLSRTINVLKKLLQERRDSLAEAAAAGASCAENVAESGSGGAAGPEEMPALLAHGASSTAAVAPAAYGSCGADPTGASFAGSATSDSSDAAAPLASSSEAEAAAAATTIPSARVGAANAAVVHHMAVPMSGHHAPMMMPPGFAGMPGHGMPTGAPNMPGHPGQPFFIAVPMYMPQGQGVPPASAAENTAAAAAQAPAAAAATTAASAPSLTAVPSTPAPAAHPAPEMVAAAPAVAEMKKEAASAPLGKEAWSLASMGYQSMMTLQMPQFVTQALSAEEGDESPTHAVCA